MVQRGEWSVSHTDTIAVIAGGLVWVYYGDSAISLSWRKAIIKECEIIGGERSCTIEECETSRQEKNTEKVL